MNLEIRKRERRSAKPLKLRMTPLELQKLKVLAEQNNVPPSTLAYEIVQSWLNAQDSKLVNSWLAEKMEVQHD